MRHPRYLSVCDRATERFTINRLTRGALHEVWSAETHEGRSLDHQDHVTECGEICTTGHTLPHHRSKLRNAQIAPHDGVVVENACCTELTGKHATLIRQIHASGVDEIHDRNATAHGHFLRAQDLRDRFRPPGAGLDGCVVGDDDNFASIDRGNGGDDTSARRLSVILIVRHQQTDFEERCAWICEAFYTFACSQLSLFVLLVDLVLTTAEPQAGFKCANFVGELAKPSGHASCC